MQCLYSTRIWVVFKRGVSVLSGFKCARAWFLMDLKKRFTYTRDLKDLNKTEQAFSNSDVSLQYW